MVSKIILSLFFVIAGILHFLKPEVYMRAMPPWIPQPLLMIYLSGICEVALGAAVVIRKVSHYAGWGLIALLIAVFPANLYMAFHPHLFPEIPVWILWLRLPLQAVLIFWVFKTLKPALGVSPR